MGDQQINFHQLQEEDNICRSMHHLSTVCAAAAGGNSAKRHSSLSRSHLQEPLPKRAALHPPSAPTAAADHDLLGYKKLPLPQYFTAASLPPLRRTSSEPIRSPIPGTTDSAAPPQQFSEFPASPVPMRSQPRQEISYVNVAQESLPLQETAPSLYRTLSEPIPSFNRQVAAPAAGTPPCPPARTNPSRSPSCGESPSAKRLRRMKERLREMSTWWNQVEKEDDDVENDESENFFTDNDPKLQEECEDYVENPPQEAVFVEKSGECLVLHFKCPCGDGYQILLSGNNCYYKLTNFRNC